MKGNRATLFSEVLTTVFVLTVLTEFWLILTHLLSGDGGGDAAAEVELLGHDQVRRGRRRVGRLSLLRDGEDLDERRERGGLLKGLT